MQRTRTSLIVVLCCMASLAAAVAEEPVGWPEAVARLATERTRAETCAAVLKRHGDEAAVERGALAYREAKAEIDGVIAGLVAGLAEGKGVESLPDLEARLRRGVAGREAFCTRLQYSLHLGTGPLGMALPLYLIVPAAEVVSSLVDAMTAIWITRHEEDRLTRETIRTQLEAARWPPFAAVSPDL